MLIKDENLFVDISKWAYIKLNVILLRTSPKMYRYLPGYGKFENKNMQNYALNLVN